MSPKLIFCLPLLLAAAAAQADGPVAAAAPNASEQAAPADSPKEPARKRAAKAADGEAKTDSVATGELQPGGDVKMSGISILGNEDAPKSLVLVPWKSSQLGDMPSVSRLLDASKQPVDKEVFMRELSYYEFRTGTK